MIEKKRILVTGGAGFIGSNFIRYFLKKHRDYIVINYDLLTYAGNLDNLKDLEKNPRYKFIKGDICDSKKIKQVIRDTDAIINFAAETHVDRSIVDPIEFIHTNVLGTYVLLEAARKTGCSKFVHISCYDEKTRALTTEGLKTYKELKRGDLVFSLNPKTFKIEVKPIEKVIIQSYKGKMIHFNNKRIDLLVTPNHNMFILSTNKKKLLVERAEKACQRSILYMPEGYWVGKNEEYFNVKGHGKVKTKDLMYILGIFIGDGFTAYQEKRIETKTGLPRKEYLKKSRDIHSGRFRKIEKQSDYKSRCHGYRVFFDIPEDDKCRKRVEKTLHNLGLKYRVHKGKAGTHLYFTSKAFMEFFNQCGRGAHNKHIPSWALEYSSKYLRYLLQGLMDSDGGQAGKIYFTVSEKLASDICELCIKLKLKPSIRNTYNMSFIGDRKVKGRSYYIFVASTTKSIYRHKNKLIDYDGNIWCLKVKDNKNFLVERNGKLDFCGNTDEVYGSILKGSFREDDNLQPNSPYAASKASADLLVRSYFATYKMPVVITRSSNNFGPYQYPEKIIPLFITNILENKKVPLYGDGLNVRDWIFVLDNCRAIDLVLHRGKVGEIYNIGGDNERSNLELTHLILKVLGKNKDLIKFVKDRPAHDRRYSLMTTKIRKLGWRPACNFEDALRKTIRWYLENKEWWQKIKRKRKEYQNYYQRQYGK
jgi:dTDP-glucose 4,6-dehydratase